MPIRKGERKRGSFPTLQSLLQKQTSAYLQGKGEKKKTQVNAWRRGDDDDCAAPMGNSGHKPADQPQTSKAEVPRTHFWGTVPQFSLAMKAAA